MLDAENQIHRRANAGCIGATTSDVAKDQLSALTHGTRLVTLTAGAADLGLSEVLAACTAVPPPKQCQTAINSALALLAVPPAGESVLGGPSHRPVRGGGRGDANALIVVTGYPVESAQNGGVNIVYVDVTGAFDDRGTCGSGAPFINPSEAGINAFHPTPAGYVAYAAAISAVLPSSWRANQEPVAQLVVSGGLVMSSMRTTPAWAPAIRRCRAVRKVSVSARRATL